MSAREARNPATQQFTKIDDVLNIGDKTNNKFDINVNVKREDDRNNEENVPGKEIDKMAALKAKMQATKKKESNQQVTVYLTPKNYKRFNQLKEKGQKSELINRLLDMYFEE